MEPAHFADRLMAEVARKRSQVVVGIDPRAGQLPPELAGMALAEAFVAFARGVIEAVAEHAAAVKPQVAFYEALGCEGMRAYAETIRVARAAGLLVIGDVKRSDIASTAAAYAAAHVGAEDGDFVADAATVNPYLGADGVRPFLDAAAKCGRGVFALVKTSNPSSADIQDLDCGGRPLYERVAELVEAWGEPLRGESGYSSLGAVVGATYPQELARLRGLMPHTPFLVPGFGAQGGGVEEVKAAFDADGLGAVVNSSRGIIYAYEREPYRSRFGAGRWREAVWAAAEEMKEELWTAMH
jgi:orotidine-5'-phosphate decarboxylase